MTSAGTTRLGAGVTVALGVAAILLPYFFSTLAVMMLAAVVLASGALALVQLYAVRRAGYAVAVFGPWAQVVAGLALLAWPDLALWLVALLLGGGLIAGGLLGHFALRASDVINPPLAERVMPWVQVAAGVLLIALGAAGSAVLLGVVIGLALIGSGLRQWGAAEPVDTR